MTVGGGADFKAGGAEKRRPIGAIPLENIVSGHACAETRQLVMGRTDDVYAGHQRFVEPRFDVQIAQTQRPHHARQRDGKTQQQGIEPA